MGGFIPGRSTIVEQYAAAVMESAATRGLLCDRTQSLLNETFVLQAFGNAEAAVLRTRFRSRGSCGHCGRS